MKRFVSNYKIWLGYLLFAVILTAVLLYYRFPTDVLKDYLYAVIERANPRLMLSLDRVQLRFPIGLKFVNTEVALKDEPDTVMLKANSLLFKPKLLSLLKGELKCLLDCIAYKGNVRGSVHLKDRQRGVIDTDIELSKIAIGDCAYLSHLIGRHIEGTLGGTVSYGGPYNLPMEGTGEANLTLSNGKVELMQPFLTLESIDFSKMEIEVALQKQKMNVTRLELNGQQLRGTLSGTIALKKEFSKSRLDLKGTVEPFAALFKGNTGTLDTVRFFKQRLEGGTLSFVIVGTLGEPKIKFT